MRPEQRWTQAAAQQGLTAGESDFADPKPSYHDANQAHDFAIGEPVGIGHPVKAVGGHAIRAAKVAPVGQRH
ncbi:hypothetical protein NIIDMKKI_06710 [Mycobacterium kansasii]|uniref:Uncharacterized protein n=1 Tax=Mycobacterium kansasii TaxID=1768 RepID=A0A7G1I6I3_MYCKA|nr:hypothetical protein NIIDMKKI_06710 [Mycobacterium kansasii]